MQEPSLLHGLFFLRHNSLGQSQIRSRDANMGGGKKNHSCSCSLWWLLPEKLRWPCFICLCRTPTCRRRQKVRSRHQEKGCCGWVKGCCVKPIFRRRKNFFSGSRGKDRARCASRCRVKPIFRRRKKTYCRSCAKDCAGCAKDCGSWAKDLGRCAMGIRSCAKNCRRGRWKKWMYRRLTG